MTKFSNLSSAVKKAISRFLLMAILAAGTLTAFAQPVTFSTGSYIIDLGAGYSGGIQNKDNGLRPYGMVYDMLKNYNVPIYFYINPTKAKDGTDITYNGHAFKGGVFIIEKTLVSSAAQTALNAWFGATVDGNGKGKVVKYDVVAGQPLTLTPNYIFKAAPTWTLDLQNGDIAKGFFTNAGIPITAYNEVLPSQLGACNDVFVMPHADPTWLTHSNLLTWNNVYKGAIWAGCHAVSALEGMYNPANISQQTNFLSTKLTSNPTSNPNIKLPVNGSTAYAQNSLVLWGNHSAGAIPPPYLTNAGTVPSGTIATPSDPVSQFMGISDLAHQNGSEQIYFPVKGGGWLPSTKIITWDNNVSAADVPGTGLGKSDGPGVIVAYGRAYGDNNRGLVMYQAGHSINKGSTGDVAAQRAFFNFSFLAMQDKIPTVSSITGLPANNLFATFPSPQNYNLSISFSSPIGASLQSVTWSAIRSDNGASAGTFVPNGTTLSGNTVFTPTAVFGGNVPIVITAKVVDVCGRTTFESVPVTLLPSPRPPVANPATKTLTGNCFGSGDIVTFDLATVTSDPDGSPMTYSIGTTGLVPGVGTWSISGSTVTFVPEPNYFGTASNTYTVCDNTASLGYAPPNNVNLCANSTISLTLGNADGNGCFPGSVYGLSTTVGATTGSQLTATVVNPTFAQGVSDLDEESQTTAEATAAKLDNSTARLRLDYGSIITSSARDSIHFFYAKSTANNVTLTLEYSSDGTAWTTLGTVTTTGTTSLVLEEAYFDFPAQLRYIRIGRSGANGDDILIDAVELEDWGCVSSLGQVVNDAFTVREDTPTDLDVLANDINPLNKAVTLTIVTAPTQGTAVVNSDNTIRYQPTKDNENNDSFTYKACTDDGACLTGTVTITKKTDACTPGNYSPLDATVSSFTLSPSKDSWYKEDGGGDDIQGGGIGTTLEVGKKNTKRKRAVLQFNTVVGNGTNQLPANATITSATLRLVRTGGDPETITLGAYKVIPGPASLAQDWTETQVTWLHRTKNTTTFWSTAGGTIDTTAYSTVTSAGNTTGNPNGIRLFNLTNMATEWYASPSTNFGVVIGQTGNVDKRHQFGSRENGTANNQPLLTINYRVEAACIAIPNYGPLARPDNQTTNSATAITFDPRTNDTDYENNPLTITGVSGITNGSATFTGTSITYTPGTGTVTPRTEKLLYTISDGQGNTHQNWVYITITNSAPILKNDNPAAVLSGTDVVVNVQNDNGNGIDSDPESQTLSGPVVTVEPKNGNYTISGTTITYTPFSTNTPGVTGFVGLDSLTYQRCETSGADGCNPVYLCSTAKVYFTINNRPPVTTPKTVNTGACVPVNFFLNTNYSDPESQALGVTITNADSESPAGTWNFTGKGSLTLNMDGSYTFTPVPNFPASPGSENVIINYNVTDTYAASASGVLTVIVTNPASNGAPVATNDNPTNNPAETVGLINDNLYISVLANDTDPENHPLTLNIPGGSGLNQIKSIYDASSVLAGTIEISGNQILFKPAYNYIGTVTFPYQVCDVPPVLSGCTPLTPQCATANVTLQINNTGINVPIQLRGTVWYDVNNSAAGTLSNIYTSGENGTNAANTLYAYLIDGVTNTVIEKVNVLPNGEYLLNPEKNHLITVFVSAADIPISTVILPGNVASNITLPTGWVATSPLSNTFTTTELASNGNDFGVQERPTAGNGVNTATNPGGTIQVTVPANTFTNSLVSSDVAPGTVSSIRITAFPTGATSIVINGTTYLPGDLAALTALIIPTDGSGNPSWTITVDPSAEEAPNSVSISFKAIDNGGFESLNTGTAVLNFNCGTDCTNFRTVKDGLWSDLTVWQYLKCDGVTWAAALTLPPTGSQVNIHHVIKQDVDFTVQACPLILVNNGSSKLIIEPNKTLGFNGGTDGNAYFNNRPVVVRSTINGTGAIGTMLTNSKTSGDENVTLERFIPGVKRRWNLLTPGVINGTTLNTTTTLRDAWAGGSLPRVTGSNNRLGSTVYALGNPPGGKPSNVPHPLYAPSASALVSNPLTSGYDPTKYTPYDGTLITGHRNTSGTQATAQGFDWWNELIIPPNEPFYITPTQTSVATNTRTTPSSIRPYRPNATTDFGQERGTHWVSNGTINSDPAKGGRSLVQLTLNELDNGYLLFTRGDRRVLENWFDSTTLRPTGKIRTGDVEVPVFGSTTQSMTLVPNPYPAPISLEKLYTGTGNNNVMAGIAHVWDSKMAGSNGLGGWVTLTRLDVNDWLAVPAVSGSHPEFVSSSQAFLVEGTAAGGNLSYKENMKVDIKTVEFTPFDNPSTGGSTGVLRANLNNRNTTTGELSVVDGVGILLDDKFTPAITDPNDVRKVFNFEGGKSLSLVRDGNLLAIEAYSNPKAETVFPLQIGNFAQQSFALTFTVRDLEKEGREAWLRDKFLGTETPISLTAPTQYNFEGNTDANSVNPNRFEIVFKSGEVLPVTFTSINAVEQGKNVKVSWNVATENKMSHYEVEHSTNGTEFGKAVKVDAKNTSPAGYEWLHIQPGSGTHFYRVRAFNLEGRSLLTKVVKVTLGDNQPGFRAFPTVVSNSRQVTLQLISLEKGRYTLQVTDMAGRVISARTIEHNGGSASTILQMPPALSAGKYNIRLSGTSGSFVESVVKD